ncbi:ABC transporter permease subunit [Alicyclobacillus kakegawensis]|uniref:ABC transporter permease subunit n=1 Tax=Alicyclobacillus kakegawensis TaxID=392012 RepID=UPI0008343B8F|nr:ABC transporter permease subunit [Alicyclobacillus kakegawensis]
MNRRLSVRVLATQRPAGLAVVAFVILAWQVAGTRGLLPESVLPTPWLVLKAGVQLAKSGVLASDLAVSAGRAFLGLAIGGSVGLVLGLVCGVFRIAETLLDSLLQMIRTIPHLALLPLVILWFGVGEVAKVFLVALGVLFPMYLNTYHGIRSVDPGLIEMGKIYGLRTFALYRRIIFPGALPSILVGLRYALGIMWTTLIVAETIAANSGIGYMAMNAREFMQMDVVVLSIVLYALLGALSDVVARMLERRWLKWHPQFLNAAS